MARPARPATRGIAKPKSSARHVPGAKRTRSRKATAPPPPLLTADQRRELSGVVLIGLGIVLAVVIALPGGGVIARVVHDQLLAAVGIGAWVVVAGLAGTGARLCAEHRWRGGILGGVGSAVVAVTGLGLLGVIAPFSAGVVGERLGGFLDRLLGPAAAAVLMVVGVCIGLVLATDLRVARLTSSIGSWWHELRLAEAERREAAAIATQANAARSDGLRANAARAGVLPGDAGRVGELSAVSAETGRPGKRRNRVRGVPAPTPPTLPGETGAALLPAESVYFNLATSAAAASPTPAVAAVVPPVDSSAVAAVVAGAGGAVAGGAVVGAEPTAKPADVPEAFAREFEAVVVSPGIVAATDPAKATAEDDDDAEKQWILPSADLLDTVTGKRERLAQEVLVTQATIVNTLRSFGIETKIIGANSGPTVTQYELQPAVGVPVRKIVGYQTDLSLALAAPIRIQPFIPGKSAIGIEVPNKAAQLVTLKEIVQAAAFTDGRHRLGVALGADVSGHPVVGDLTRMPHLLIAGATGSGKSVSINALLAGFLLQATPAQLKLILIDPKRVELSGFADIPHLLVPVVVEPEAAVASLRWAVKEMEERYKLFASNGARNIGAFNERAPGLGLAPLPFTVIVIDELADLMMVAAGEIEDLICRIAQLARAVGIHLIVATQRPSADIITGLIKANIPSRVAFAVSSGVDSRVILDEMGAEKLLGRGDMLYLPIDEGKPRRLQGAYVSDRELDAVIAFWKAQGLPAYQDEIFRVEATVSWAKEAGKRDPLFAKAAHTVAAEGRAAASLLQRKLNVGYARAARLVDQLAEHRIVGPYEGSKSRELLMDVLQVDELLAELGEQ